MSEGSLFVVYASPKKFTTANFRAGQNHSFRINSSRRILLLIFSIGNFHAETTRRTKLPIMNTSGNRARNPRRMSSSVFKDLNLPGINTYKKWQRGGPRVGNWFV